VSLPRQVRLKIQSFVEHDNEFLSLDSGLTSRRFSLKLRVQY
jgi:hypothetical protein